MPLELRFFQILVQICEIVYYFIPVSLGFGNSGSDNGDCRGGDSGVIITTTGT